MVVEIRKFRMYLAQLEQDVEFGISQLETYKKENAELKDKIVKLESEILSLKTANAKQEVKNKEDKA